MQVWARLLLFPGVEGLSAAIDAARDRPERSCGRKAYLSFLQLPGLKKGGKKDPLFPPFYFIVLGFSLYISS